MDFLFLIFVGILHFIFLLWLFVNPLLLKNRFIEFLEYNIGYYFCKENSVFLNIIFKSVKKDLRLILKKDKEFLSNFNSHYRLKLLEECLNHDIDNLKSKK